MFPQELCHFDDVPEDNSQPLFSDALRVMQCQQHLSSLPLFKHIREDDTKTVKKMRAVERQSIGFELPPSHGAHPL